MFYAISCTLLLIIIAQFIDLPYLFGNWEIKARSILNFNLTDNFYPPGAALALIPFLWAGPTFSIGVFFYYLLSAFTYHKLCNIIENPKLRKVALLALPANPYLSWLCLTSADQVVELLFLLLFIYFAIKDKFVYAIFLGWMLCLTRPAYWVAYIIILAFFKLKISNNIWRKAILRCSGLIMLIITLFGNVMIFSSPNLSTSSGLTFLYSHNKYHYLSLPKFDMDVFLNDQMNPGKIIGNSNKFSFVKDEYTRAGLISIEENPKQFMLASLQKINSYFFSVERVPNLPGQYYLSQDAKTIVIGNERLSWSIVIGNTLYLIYRSTWMLFFSITITYLLIRKIQRDKISNREVILFLPYLCGIVPGLLYYVETRFKICAELVLVPLMAIIFSKILNAKINNDQEKFS
jgi:hypothetical protein